MTIGLSFMIQTLKTYQYETGKLLINRDIRKFTTQMIDDATYANSFQIYDQVSNLSRGGYTLAGSADPTGTNYKGYTAALATTGAANPVDVTLPGTEAVPNAKPGDVLVLIYNETTNNTKIRQLIIYYRVKPTIAGGSNGTNSTLVTDRMAALNRLVVTVESSAQTASILKLLPDLTAPTTPVSTIFPFVDGQANDLVPTGSVNRTNKMFYNNNPSILIRGRIYENYTAQRLIRSTYNFTVSPRG